MSKDFYAQNPRAFIVMFEDHWPEVQFENSQVIAGLILNTGHIRTPGSSWDFVRYVP
jgi:hypothetical protein